VSPLVRSSSSSYYSSPYPFSSYPSSLYFFSSYLFSPTFSLSTLPLPTLPLPTRPLPSLIYVSPSSVCLILHAVAIAIAVAVAVAFTLPSLKLKTVPHTIAGQWYARTCDLPPVVPREMALSCYQTIYKMNVLTFGGGKLLGKCEGCGLKYDRCMACFGGV
jgi:hypothetical protein